MQATYSLTQLPEVAKRIIENCTTKTILFYGDMGVGKTTLIKELVKELGSTDIVSSPTFSIVNEYRTKENVPIYHFDFYRLNDPEEALDIGVEDYFDSDSWILIEWPEKINNFLPNMYHSAKIVSLNEKKREIIFSYIC